MMVIANLRFTGDLSPIWVAALAIIAAGAVVWYYLRESRTVASPYSFLLPGLRASAIALAIMVLAGPVWHREQTVGALGRIVFALDTSASMSVTDSGTRSEAPTRLDRATELLLGRSDKMGWLELLSKTHIVDVIAFAGDDWTTVWSSRQSDRIPAAIDLQPDGSQTDLTQAMAASLATRTAGTMDQSNQPEPFGGEALVLLSDGRQNTGGSPIDQADRLRSAGIQIHTLGMGSPEEPIDTCIVDVERPETVAADGRLAGQISLRQLGAVDASQLDQVSVQIESNDVVVWQENVQLNPSGPTTVQFELEVEPIVQRVRSASPRGVRRNTVVLDLKASVTPAPGDTNPDNDLFSFRVAATSRDRRLLILDGSSRWETRYVRNLFQRDPAWSVDTVLYGPGTDMPTVKRGDQPGQFPNSRDAMARYDAIVLGEVPPDQFTIGDADLLRDFVARGGGLIVIDGRYKHLRRIIRESLGDLVPVDYGTNDYPMPVRSIRPTPMGLEHPVLNLWGDRAQLAEFWDHVPSPPIAPRLEAQPGSEVWAYAVGTDGHESPWMIARLFGAGRVFYLATDQTWRWRYKVADRFHARFWTQLLLAVMQPPYSASDDYVALGTNKIEYEVNESALVRARVQDITGQPVGDATVDALLMADHEIVATVPLVVDDPARGTYQGQTPPLAKGSYEVRIRASGFDANALQASTPIWVGSRDTEELSQVGLDQALLRQLAQSGGGTYVHESDANQMFEQLRPLSRGRIVETDILVWQSFYWFWAILGLLTLEWWLRKVAGLV